jgi:predicted acyltransferase
LSTVTRDSKAGSAFGARDPATVRTTLEGVAGGQIGQRFRAIDVIRGLTVALMIVVNMQIGPGKSYVPLLHAPWNGLTPTDVVFPTFMFVVGAALSFTLEKYAAMGSAVVLRKIGVRTALIFLCGFLLYWFPFFAHDTSGDLIVAPLSHTRILGVLQRIALGYGAAALIVYYGGRAGAIGFALIALPGYWWMMHTFGDYSLAGNAEIKLDKLVLGEAHMYHGEGVAFDPEGILSTLPAIVNVLAGYLTGRFIRDHGAGRGTIIRLLLAGAVCVALSLWWNTSFPINKKIWTSPFALCTIGIDFWLIAALLRAVPQGKESGWTHFFEVFGRNTLVIYLLSEVGQTLLQSIHIGKQTLFRWLYSVGFAPWAGDKPGSLLYAVAFMLGCWCAGYLMDRKRIYIKL